MTLRSILLSILTTITVSCTVKEERSGCPCRLTVDLSDAEEKHGPALVSIWENSAMSCQRQVPITGHTAEFTENVTKSVLEVSAIQGLEKNKIEGRNVVIAEGDDMDRTMVYGAEITADQEQMVVKALFRKNWTTLTIEYENPGSGEYPFYFVITGQINGFDAYSMTPTQGRFRYRAEKQHADKDECTADIPRQFNGADDLRLSIMSIKTGKLEKEYDLSAMILEAGYDWTCKNLNDIHIHINYAGLAAGIEITGWDNGSDFSVTI